MRVLVVAAHPDDEVLGCGATMARHADEGDEVHVLILGEGATSRAPEHPEALASKVAALESAARAAAKVLGAADVTFGSFPDNRFDTVPLLDIVKRVEQAGEHARPSVVYTHHGGDLNVDHRLTQQAVLTAFRPIPGDGVEQLLAFEVASSTEWQAADAAPPFLPDHWVDVVATLPRKLEALRAYEDEMRPFPHARSFEGIQAHARSAGAQVGVRAAERFRTLRSVRRSSPGS